jgi:hypothetical protein
MNSVVTLATFQPAMFWLKVLVEANACTFNGVAAFNRDTGSWNVASVANLHQGRDARNVPARYVSIEDRRTIHTIERTIETGCARDVPLSDVLIERTGA